MGKIVLNETQYKRLQNILVDSVINEGFINESSKTNQNSNTLIFEENNPQILSEGEYELKKFNKLNKGGNTYWALAKGVTFKPSEKTAGYLVAKPQTLYKSTGISSWDKIPNKTVIYTCSKGKFHIQGEKGYYDRDLYNEDLSKALKPLCSESQQKTPSNQNNTSVKTPDDEKVYTMVRGTYDVKSDDGNTYTIPDGTRYVYNADKKGASFRLDKNKFGWFGCKSKIFVIDSVKYKDTKGYLANNIVNAICEVAPKKNETNQGDQYKSYGSNVGNVGGGGGSEKYDTSEFDLYI